MTSGSFHASDFTPLVGTSFDVVDGSERASLTLRSVEVTHSPVGHEQFALMLLGPIDGPRDQRTYTLRHDSLGDVAIFLVPIGESDRGVEFQACFNNFVDDTLIGGSDESVLRG